MVRRGFTLIEMLAVIAIVLVVMAISLPAIEGRLASARFDAAAARIDSGMAWARAEAQRRGEALRIEVRPSGKGIGLFLARFEVIQEHGRDGDAEEQKPQTEPFAVLEPGLVLSDRAPRTEGEESGNRTDGAPAPDEGADPKAPLIVAVFLPDGSAMAAGQVYLSGFERAASLLVNHWTGGVKVAEVDLKQKAESGEAGTAGSTGSEKEAER